MKPSPQVLENRSKLLLRIAEYGSPLTSLLIAIFCLSVSGSDVGSSRNEIIILLSIVAILGSILMIVCSTVANRTSSESVHHQVSLFSLGLCGSVMLGASILLIFNLLGESSQLPHPNMVLVVLLIGSLIASLPWFALKVASIAKPPSVHPTAPTRYASDTECPRRP